MSDIDDSSLVTEGDAMGTMDEIFRLDGNAAAGLLAEIFVSEMTTAECTCEQCGGTTPLGSLLMYGGKMGTVLRCPTCDHVQMRILHIPERGEQHILNMQGMTRLVMGSSAPG